MKNRYRFERSYEINGTFISYEILQIIMGFLTPSALCNMELVCKYWQILASDDNVWLAATDYTKEEYRKEQTGLLYTIVNMHIHDMECRPLNDFKVDEIKLRNYINDAIKRTARTLQSTYWKNDPRGYKIYWPERIGNILHEDNNVLKNENIITKDFEKLLDIHHHSYSEYMNIGAVEFCIGFRLIGNEIHLYSIKNLSPGFIPPWLELEDPIIFNRNIVYKLPNDVPQSRYMPCNKDIPKKNIVKHTAGDRIVITQLMSQFKCIDTIFNRPSAQQHASAAETSNQDIDNLVFTKK